MKFKFSTSDYFLRKTAQKYPQYAVSNWIGHNIEVSARHYLQAPAELYSKVAATKETQTATKKVFEGFAKK